MRVHRIPLAEGVGRSELATKTSTKPPLALPDRPSIAVLAFQNMSGDSEQEYFADGMVEEIITALSRIRWLFVIARNSSFTYKGQAVDVKRVGRELGVRYVLEGSVRKADRRLRITAQQRPTPGEPTWYPWTSSATRPGPPRRAPSARSGRSAGRLELRRRRDCWVRALRRPLLSDAICHSLPVDSRSLHFLAGHRSLER